MPPLSKEVADYILRCLHRTPRTKWAYEQAQLRFPTDGITLAQVRAVAVAHGIELERGPEKGKGTAGGGRPKGSRSSKHRARVLELHAQGKTQPEIAKEVGISQQAVSYLLSDDAQRKA